MKKLRMLLIMVLVVSMVLPTAAFAKFSDVEDGTPVAEATEVLSALGILKGEPNGTFRPNDTITRAEVVAVANRIQGLSDAAAGAAGQKIYTDVPSNEWYAGDVNLATQMGIISGDGDGTFRPEDPVTYEEAIKIIVLSMGYQDKYVLSKGGWPTGYLVIASESGVSKGIKLSAGNEASRGIVARLLYNALDAPMMVSDGFNSDGTYQYKIKNDKQLGYDKLNVLKVDLSVVANNVNGSLGADKVKVNVTGGYGIYDEDFFYAESSSAGRSNIIINTNGTGIGKYLGYTVTAFVTEDDYGEWKVLSFVASTKNNTDKISDLNDVVSTTARKYPSKYDTISVYDDDHDTTNVEYVLNTTSSGTLDISYYVNGAKQTFTGVDSLIGDGKAELLDNNGDGLYDVIFVTRYRTAVVDSIYGSNKKISLKDGAGYIDLTDFLSKTKKNKTLKMTMNGNDILPEDLKEFDVLTIMGDATNINDSKNLEIIATREVIEGTLDEYDDDTYVINGKAYEANGMFSGARAGDEGKFYLDAFGKIAYSEKTSATKSNYAFVVNSAVESSVGELYYVLQLFTKDGSIRNYDLADKVNLNDSGRVAASVAYNAVASQTLGVAKTSAQNNYADRIITYKVNSSGKITALKVLSPTLNCISSPDHWSDKVGFSRGSITDKTVIFSLPVTSNATKDDFKIISKSSLSDDTYYQVAYYDYDSYDDAGLAIITNNETTIGGSSNLAVFVRAASVADDNYKVTFVQNGKEKTVLTSDDMDSDIDFSLMAKGDMFNYSLASDGTFSKVRGLNYRNYISTGFVSISDNNTTAYDFGYVKSKRDNIITLGKLYDRHNIRPVAESANLWTNDSVKRSLSQNASYTMIDYTVSNTSSKRVTTSSIYEITQVEFQSENGSYSPLEEERDIALFIKYYKDDIIDVILIKGAYEYQNAYLDNAPIRGAYCNHTYQVTTPEVPATCGSDGTTAIETCTGCNKTRGGDVIPATGAHNYQVTTPEVPATCGSDGATAIETCTGCNQTRGGDVIPALSHDFEKHDPTAATCLTEGNIEYFSCKLCRNYFVKSGDEYIKKLLSDLVIPKLAHTDENSDGFCDICGNAIGLIG